MNLYLLTSGFQGAEPLGQYFREIQELRYSDRIGGVNDSILTTST